MSLDVFAMRRTRESEIYCWSRGVDPGCSWLSSVCPG